MQTKTTEVVNSGVFPHGTVTHNLREAQSTAQSESIFKVIDIRRDPDNPA
jgi:hypothetical protein